MGCVTPSVIVVDLNIQAVDIACRLGSLVNFLEAANELHTCSHLESSTFRRHSRKIVSLVEVARKTLTAVGISLHLFCTCPPTLAPLRTAYVRLLELLKDRRHDIDATLQERVRHLLQPLSSGFAIQRRGEPTPTPLFQIPPRCSIRGNHSHEQQSDAPIFRPSTSMSAAYSSLMPPPSAFPVVMVPKRTSSPRRRQRLWDPEIFTSKRPHKRSRSPIIDQENQAPAPRLVRPIPRRFGIFCTNKNSMPSQERVGRPRAPRALTKD